MTKFTDDHPISEWQLAVLNERLEVVYIVIEWQLAVLSERLGSCLYSFRVVAGSVE